MCLRPRQSQVSLFTLTNCRGKGPLCSAAFALPTKSAIDKPLLIGSALFGSGARGGAIELSRQLCGIARATQTLAAVPSPAQAGRWQVRLGGTLADCCDRCQVACPAAPR